MEVQINIEADDFNYFFCLQDMFEFRNPVAFPALSRFQRDGEEWMTSDQERIADILGWTCVVLLALAAAIWINRIVIRFLRRIFFTDGYKVRRCRFVACRYMLAFGSPSL